MKQIRGGIEGSISIFQSYSVEEARMGKTFISSSTEAFF